MGRKVKERGNCYSHWDVFHSIRTEFNIRKS